MVFKKSTGNPIYNTSSTSHHVRLVDCVDKNSGHNIYLVTERCDIFTRNTNISKPQKSGVTFLTPHLRTNPFNGDEILGWATRYIDPLTCIQKRNFSWRIRCYSIVFNLVSSLDTSNHVFRMNSSRKKWILVLLGQNSKS